jgi:hypothetical protein
MRTYFLALSLYMLSVSIAVADVGNCWVMSDCYEPLDAKTQKTLAKQIDLAYQHSEIGDYNLCFCFRIDSRFLKSGEYQFANLELRRNGGDKYWGYVIAGGDLAGLESGVAKAAEALQKSNKAFSSLKTNTKLNFPANKPEKKAGLHHAAE